MKASATWDTPTRATHWGTGAHYDCNGTVSFTWFGGSQTADVRVRECAYTSSLQILASAPVGVFISWDKWIEDGGAEFRLWRDNSPIGAISLVQDAVPFWGHDPDRGWPSPSRKAATLDECIRKWFS